MSSTSFVSEPLSLKNGLKVFHMHINASERIPACFTTIKHKKFNIKIEFMAFNELFSSPYSTIFVLFRFHVNNFFRSEKISWKRNYVPDERMNRTRSSYVL